MWSGSPLKFEHPQQGGQDSEYNNGFPMPSAMPATPSNHRRGQSLSALHNLPRTPTNHQLRPPVYLQSPLATNPTGLMGVGDVFAPSGFNENMGMYASRSPESIPQTPLTREQHITRQTSHPPEQPWTTSMRTLPTSTCPALEDLWAGICSTLLSHHRGRPAFPSTTHSQGRQPSP